MRSVLVASAMLVALSVAPAAAKVQVMPEDAVLSGPGLDEDIHLGSGPASGLVDKTRSWDTFYGGSWLNSMDNFEGELGPRYTITYTLGVQDHARPGKTRTSTFTQYIYPFATGGPVQVVPPKQKLPVRGIHEMASGWARLDKFAMLHLEYYGLPKTDVSGGVPAGDAGGSEPPDAPYLWALAAVLLLGIGVLGHRRVWMPRHPAV